MRRTLFLAAAVVAALVMVLPAAAGPARLRVFSTSRLAVAAWSHAAQATIPATGTFDVSGFPTLSGFVGLQPGSALTGTVTFRWYTDPAGQDLVGGIGLPVTGLIVSTAQLHYPNLGPYLRVSIDCWRDNARCSDELPFALRVYGSTSAPGPELVPWDTLLITERKTLAANTAWAVYTDDYYTGPVAFHFQAPAGWAATVYARDLTGQQFEAATIPAGDSERIVPRGTWWVVIANTTSSPGTFQLTATPSP